MVLGVGVLEDLVVLEEVLVVEVLMDTVELEKMLVIKFEESSAVDTEVLEEGEGDETKELVSISTALEVVRAEDVMTGEIVAIITALVSRELFPFSVVGNETSRLEELTVGKDTNGTTGLEELTVDKDTNVVGS